MKMLIFVFVASAAACSNPVAGPSPTSAPAPATLRWDLVAPGCSPATPYPVVQRPEQTVGSATSLRAVYPPSAFVGGPYERPEAGQRFVLADFVLTQGSWALCSWQTIFVGNAS